jgi:hypothetical protein
VDWEEIKRKALVLGLAWPKVNAREAAPYRNAAISRMREDTPNLRKQAPTWCFTVGSALPRKAATSLLL